MALEQAGNVSSNRGELTENIKNEVMGSGGETTAGITEISSNLQEFNLVTQEREKALKLLPGAAAELAKLASELRSKAGAFTID